MCLAEIQLTSPLTDRQMRELALVMAEMNMERAKACSPEQDALRAFFEQNARMFVELCKALLRNAP